MARSKEFIESEVLEKAIHLFTIKGYHGTSAQDLVEKLGISRSSLYDTFGDKHSLYIRVLNHYLHVNTGHVIQLLEKSENIRITLEAIFHYVIEERHGDSPNIGCLMVNAGTEMGHEDAEVADIVALNKSALEEALFRAIQKGQRSNQISCRHDPQALTHFIFTLIMGLRVVAKSGGCETQFRNSIQLMFSVL